MAQVTLVLWRDIPAQVIVGKGRNALKRPLAARFEQAIDRAAMKAGAHEADAYLAAWRKSGPVEVAGSEEHAAEAEAARIDMAYGNDRLRRLIAAGGWDNETAQGA